MTPSAPVATAIAIIPPALNESEVVSFRAIASSTRLSKKAGITPSPAETTISSRTPESRSLYGRKDGDAEDTPKLAQRAVRSRGDARFREWHRTHHGVGDGREAERGADAGNGERDAELDVAHVRFGDQRHPTEPDCLHRQADDHEGPVAVSVGEPARERRDHHRGRSPGKQSNAGIER